MLETMLQQYIVPLATWFVALFTPAEWRAFVLLIGVTLAATHTIKIAWRLSPIKGSTHGQVYLASAFIGFASAPFIWPNTGWWIPAVMAGPAAALTFKLAFALLKKIAPGVADIVNVERRLRDQGPPGGFPRRKSDKEEA